MLSHRGLGLAPGSFCSDAEQGHRYRVPAANACGVGTGEAMNYALFDHPPGGQSAGSRCGGDADGRPAEPRTRWSVPDLTEPPWLPSLLFTEDLDIFSCGDKVGPSLRCFSDERRRHPASPRGVLTVNWQGTPSPAGGPPSVPGYRESKLGCGGCLLCAFLWKKASAVGSPLGGGGDWALVPEHLMEPHA